MLNPGIRKTVEWLNAHGFVSCDSGDGKTHDFGCDRTYPYVVVKLPPFAIDSLVGEADRLKRLVEDQIGFPIEPLGPDPGAKPEIQASYDPASGSALIDLMGVTDAMLWRN